MFFSRCFDISTTDNFLDVFVIISMVMSKWNEEYFEYVNFDSNEIELIPISATYLLFSKKISAKKSVAFSNCD